MQFLAQKAFFGFVTEFRVRMTGGEMDTGQAARGWAARTQAGSILCPISVFFILSQDLGLG